MERTVSQQVAGFITKLHSFIIVLPNEATLDSMASGMALCSYLMELGKEVVVVSNKPVPKQVRFLEAARYISSKLKPSGTFAVVLDTKTIKLGELSYDTSDEAVRIFLKAKNGNFTSKDISFEEPSGSPECIITIGSESFESLGTVFTDNAELFYSLPKINIDINPNNEYYGSVNIVDVTSGAIAEVLFHLFSAMELGPISKTTATALLTGIIANTNSFQGVRTTPNSMLIASSLITLGADQQDVIKHLFKTKEFSLLKLWGRALARLKIFPENSFAYTGLTSTDFEKTEASIVSIPLVLQEFLDNIADIKVFAILAERSGSVNVVLSIHPQLRLDVFTNSLGVTTVLPTRLPGGMSYIQVALPGTLLEVESKVAHALMEGLPVH